MTNSTPTHHRARQGWLNAYWVEHCEGYRVETATSHVGFVEEVIWDLAEATPTALSIRLGSDDFDLITVPIGQVKEIRPDAEAIVLARGLGRQTKGTSQRKEE